MKLKKTILGLASAALLMSTTMLSAETVKIGVIAALTGGGAPWGQAAAIGTEIAAKEINDAGGLDINGVNYTIEVIAYDDKYKASESVTAYNRLVNVDGVKYVVILSSSGTMALRQNVEDDGVLALSSAYSLKAIDDTSKHMFRIYSPPADYVPGFVKWMAGNLTERSVVIVNPNDETGWDQTKLSETVFKSEGFDVIGQELFERSQVDFQPMLTKIMALNPEIIELGGTSPGTAGLIVRQARELGFKGLFSKMGGSGPAAIVKAAGIEASEGILNMLYADPDNAGYQKLAATYEEMQGHAPNEIVVSFYDAANVLFRAMVAAGTVDDTDAVAAAFAEALPMMSVQGDELTLGGKDRYGIDAQIMSVNYIGVIRNGLPVVIGKTK